MRQIVYGGRLRPVPEVSGECLLRFDTRPWYGNLALCGCYLDATRYRVESPMGKMMSLDLTQASCAVVCTYVVVVY
jgi:hypothetical protein